MLHQVMRKLIKYFITIVLVGLLYIVYTTAGVLKATGSTTTTTRVGSTTTRVSSPAQNSYNLDNHSNRHLANDEEYNTFISAPNQQISDLQSNKQLDNPEVGNMQVLDQKQSNRQITQAYTSPDQSKLYNGNSVDKMRELQNYDSLQQQTKNVDVQPAEKHSKSGGIENEMKDDGNEGRRRVIHTGAMQRHYAASKLIFHDGAEKQHEPVKPQPPNNTNTNSPQNPQINNLKVSQGQNSVKVEANHDEQQHEQVPSNPSTRTDMTIILTEGRSGSTWLMEVLAHPPKAMLFFEPLNARVSERFQLTKGGNESEGDFMGRWRRSKLLQICTCHLQDFTMGAISGWQRNYQNLSKLYPIKSVMEDCSTLYNTRVAKTIRLYNITDLELLEESGCPNYKIVHLIRDPRAVMLSRMKTFRELYDGNRVKGAYIVGGIDKFDNDYVSRAARDFCNNHMYNIKQSAEEWVSRRYKRVLYEDFAKDPTAVARELYHFIDQTFTPSDVDFVYEGSHQTKGGGGYDTSKNSTLVLNQWKKKILPRHLQVIERECRELMEMLGYKFGLN